MWSSAHPCCARSAQIIIYNHGMLALHAEGSLAVVGDLDEYLVTPRPMELPQVWLL